MRILPLGRVVAVGAVSMLALGGVAGLASSPAYAAADSQVSGVQGITGQAVDVYVNSEKTIPDFQACKVAGPLSLRTGQYDIALTSPGYAIGSTLLKVDDAEVHGDANISLVAHLYEQGELTLTP